jgi:hypothetical protein
VALPPVIVPARGCGVTVGVATEAKAAATAGVRVGVAVGGRGVAVGDGVGEGGTGVAVGVGGSATPYSDSLSGSTMGCTGAGPYNPNDVSVIAVSPVQYSQIPCGTRLEICGPVACINGVRKDSCPGCGPGSVDLSRVGFKTVCGASANSCAIKMRALP